MNRTAPAKQAANGLRLREDCTRPVLDFVHGLLAAPHDSPPAVETQLARLASTFRAHRAGFVGLSGSLPAVQFGRAADGKSSAGLDWSPDRWGQFLAQVPRAIGGALALSFDDKYYLF